MASVAFFIRLVQGLLGGDFNKVQDGLFLVRRLWYAASLGLAPGRKTVRRMQALIPGAPTNRHGIERVIKDQHRAARELLRLLGHRRLADLLERKRYRRISILLDTTNLQRFGKRMEGAFKFKDNSTNGYILGHRTVVCIALVGKTIVPLGCRLFIRKEDAPKLHVEYKSQIDLADQLIRELPPFPKGVQVEVLADSFFFCKQLVNLCRSNGYVFTSRAKTNQTVTGPGPGARTNVGKKMKKAFAHRQAKPVTTRVRSRARTFLIVRRVHFYRGMGAINTLYSRERGKRHKPVALVTTDLSATAEQIIQATGRRWAIELFFRSCKQDLGMGHYQGRHWEGVDQHLQLVLVAHLLLSCAGSRATPAAGKSTKGDTLSGLQDLRAGRARLQKVMVQDLLASAQTVKAARATVNSHVELVFGP